MPMVDRTKETTGSWKMTPAPMSNQVKKLKQYWIEKLFSTCGAATPLKNSKENGIRTRYPNETPAINDVNAKNTNGRANFFSFTFNPGATNCQNWYIKYGSARMKPDAKDINHFIKNML